MGEARRPDVAEALSDDDRVVFYDTCSPVLQPGDYRVELKQQLHVAAGTDSPAARAFKVDPLAATLAFSVDPAAATFDPADIHGLYPPAGSEGGYAGTLPHVVFNRRTLPWECALEDGKGPFAGAPWLALLLLAADEVPPEPSLPQDPSKPRDPSTLELPGRQFKALAPGVAQLRALAHVRQVDTRHKEVQAVNDRGWFSVVVGNRVVREGAYQAFLVSLQEHGSDLQGTPKGPTVRLKVLKQWRFFSNGSEGFAARLLGKGAAGDRAVFPGDDPWLRRPPLPPGPADQDPGLRAIVDAAHRLGHASFVHAMRDGASRLSWYRGPLVPVLHARPAVREPVPCADAVLQYDPRTGMLDTSYAAAWQLGRLLVLQNPAFSLALHRARRHRRSQAQRLLDDMLTDAEADPSAAETVVDAGHSEDEIVAFLLGAGGRTLGEAIAGASEPEGPRPAAAAPTCPAPPDETDPPPEPDDALRWLGRLVLLHGVPLRYLVPDETMLPPGSLRCFLLDPYWVQVLVQGACSIGEARRDCGFVDEALRSLTQEGGPALGLADAVVGCREQLRAQHENVQPRAQAATSRLEWPLSGLLLRSPLVAAHKGLEILGWCADPGAAERPLAPLRIERVGDDVLLALFNGRLDRLEIRPPQEALHFCLDPGMGSPPCMRAPTADGSFARDVLEPDEKGGAAFAERWLARSRSVVVRCRRGDEP